MFIIPSTFTMKTVDSCEINHYFYTLTNFPPRQFQLQTIAHLLNRQDVLLRAPTGSGKTETAIAPFLFAKPLKLDFPNKLIYVVPLRTLANSLRQRTETLINNWSTYYPLSRPLTVTLQTGENPEDPRFEGDIIFCTIDQMLSSFLNIPYSVGRGSANVNAGAIFASYLVPTPYAIKMALLKVLLEGEGKTNLTNFDRWIKGEFSWIRDLQIFIQPPERLVVNRNGYKLRYYDQTADKADKTRPTVPMQDGFVFREGYI
jgi:CRISPR-associated endonuclease/helicase Cas3